MKIVLGWVFGDFLCKMNQFIHGLSCTASIIILIVISIERYLAIIHPIRCKQILTRNRLKFSRVEFSFVYCLDKKQ
ncbi:hypothetical protein Phum_PHUM618870 [Pediculus humanus corporis]|uniref:G-protein coupled receptors family 1 profile domain-containing protein n=1 Tax=Pediculus humanus subsp. corporis TaxID=121224 RepID=E0W4G3_PEDHC|nr:uncharacterized protein Phum_PHUM618870 [Pediculus humanus corporis]EEB20519.1 hypothetical protein Phum_PHUM618870 [Pediculus humanus corporis]